MLRGGMWSDLRATSFPLRGDRRASDTSGTSQLILNVGEMKRCTTCLHLRTDVRCLVFPLLIRVKPSACSGWEAAAA